MPKLLHETFVRAFDNMLTRKLMAYEGEAVNTPLKFFGSCGSADVDMVPHQAKALAEDLGLSDVPSCYRPDASWSLFDRSRSKQRRPGLVLEVCSKQRKSDALKKLPFYFASTDAEVRCVIIADLTKALKATVSVYIANYDMPRGTAAPTINTIVLKDDKVRYLALLAYHAHL